MRPVRLLRGTERCELLVNRKILGIPTFFGTSKSVASLLCINQTFFGGSAGLGLILLPKIAKNTSIRILIVGIVARIGFLLWHRDQSICFLEFNVDA